MKNAKIIIGSGFGDEGKGLFTDYFASRCGGHGCVVRFNGGAQAGHTVQLEDGRRHVFSHFGSGSYAGLPTFLSSFFACSPMTFGRERSELENEGVSPKVYVDPFCPITTPYDVMLNQIAEQVRGANRHGSVGVGFGETVERQSFAAYSLFARDLSDVDFLCEKLEIIRTEWFPRRLKALGIAEPPEEWAQRVASYAIMDHFVADCADFLESVTLAEVRTLNGFDELIFEGAQGLLLDQSRGEFPHVTRSNTGIKNALEIAKTIGLTSLDAYYLTRSYVTRHGAGPLQNELPTQPYAKISDPTNRPHPYQGDLRFAWLDMDVLRAAINADLGDVRDGAVSVRPHLGMSCLDQIDDRAVYISSGALHSVAADDLAEIAGRAIGAEDALASYGPTRSAINKRVIKARRSRRASGIGNGYRLLEAFNVAQSYALAAVG